MTAAELHKAIAEYFVDKKDVVAVYLFGSNATGNKRPLSDIDIGILLDQLNYDPMGERKGQYIVELGRILRRDIHPVILNSSGMELLRQVFSKGVCILENDSEKHARLRTFMFADIAEFGYYRRQMQLGLIRNIMEGGQFRG